MGLSRNGNKMSEEIIKIITDKTPETVAIEFNMETGEEVFTLLCAAEGGD